VLPLTSSVTVPAAPVQGVMDAKFRGWDMTLMAIRLLLHAAHPSAGAISAATTEERRTVRLSFLSA